ncbi:unnamed protein product, partial [Prorocentrum cordatum]
MEPDWVPGTQLLVSFVSDPGFRHERVIVWPCHEDSWVVYTGGGDLYVEEEKDSSKVYLMTAGQPPRSLPDDGAKVVQFARFPTDDELRGLIVEARSEVTALRRAEPDRVVPPDPLYFLSEDGRRYPLVRHRLQGKQVGRAAPLGDAAAADGGAGAPPPLAAGPGSSADQKDGAMVGGDQAHRWVISEPGLVWELGTLVAHGRVRARLDDRGVADINGNAVLVQLVPEEEVGDYAAMKASAFELAIRDASGVPTEFGRRVGIVPTEERGAATPVPAAAEWLPTPSLLVVFLPLDAAPLSLPRDVSSAPAVGSLVTGRALEYLVEAEGQMIRADAETQLDRETNGEIEIFTDPLLANSRRRYSTFVKDLRRKGLAGFTREPTEFVGVFFVWGKERASMGMAIDCRRSNQRFVTPPGVDLLSTEGLGRIECEAEKADALPIFLGKADVKDCFHRVLFGSHLSKYFCYPGGMAKDYLWPCALALPMGWTWSLCFAKVANLGMVERAPAVASSRVATDRGPPIVLAPSSSWHYVYVDNVGLLSLDAACVKGALADATEAFDAAGLIMHDISVACETAEALGVTLDGQKRQTLVTHRRYWKVRLGLRGLEVLLGHCAFVGLMCRETLSAWHAVCTFIRERYWAKSDVWDSARRELECFLGLMPLLRSEWDRPWLPQVLSVGASLRGWGIASSRLGASGYLLALAPLLRLASHAQLPPIERGPSDVQEAGVWEMREDFPEIPGGLLRGDWWRLILHGKWAYSEDIQILEARVLVKA